MCRCRWHTGVQWGLRMETRGGAMADIPHPPHLVISLGTLGILNLNLPWPSRSLCHYEDIFLRIERGDIFYLIALIYNF